MSGNAAEDQKIEKIIATLDHKDKEKITWSEFLDWFSNEGKTRQKIHNAGLYKTGITRIVEDQSNFQGSQPSSEFRLSQNRTEYRVESVHSVEVTGPRKSLHILLCIFENKVA